MCYLKKYTKPLLEINQIRRRKYDGLEIYSEGSVTGAV